MSEYFFVTTPIYYINDIPHIGHAYTTIAADILARHNRLLGKKVFFLTGTDEHGQKVEKAATLKGHAPKQHADEMVENFMQLWKRLNISNDAFIRTTDSEHIKTVQALIQRLWEKGEIQKRQYFGWYCTPDERFWTEKELIDGNCPDCKRPVEQICEENYFFLMSKYQARLIGYIEENPAYILPDTRRNEVLGFLKNNELGDLCISRPRQRLSWGIPLPFDKEFIIYVWFDALVNYYSATKYLAPENTECGIRNAINPESEIQNQKLEYPQLSVPRSQLNWWPASHHIIGKDILTTHAVYWSTMLMALDIPLSRNIFAHGWWTAEGRKMSKSFGNVVEPGKMLAKYGIDAFRYFLFREVPFGLDGDFSEDALISRINTDLSNDLGNLLNRFLTMAEKYFNGEVRSANSGTSIHSIIDEHKKECIDAVSDAMNNSLWTQLRFNLILEHIWNIVRATNNIIAKTEPWKLARQDKEALENVIFNVWNALRLTAVLLYPFMPQTAEKLWEQLGLEMLTDEARQSLSASASIASAEYPGIFLWDWKPAYNITIHKKEQLFPRIERLKENPMDIKTGMGGGKTKMYEQGIGGLIDIEDFSRIELKVGKVISAERVSKSDKLLKLIVDTGEKRQIVAGIGKVYTPEYLVGKKIVIVANLKPAKLMGIESSGMLLAATDEDGALSVLSLDKDVKAGARVK